MSSLGYTKWRYYYLASCGGMRHESMLISVGCYNLDAKTSVNMIG